MLANAGGHGLDSAMEIDLTVEQLELVRYAVASGRIQDQSEAVREAMSLWVDRERRRVELLASLDAAEASLADGKGIAITLESGESMIRRVMGRI